MKIPKRAQKLLDLLEYKAFLHGKNSVLIEADEMVRMGFNYFDMVEIPVFLYKQKLIKNYKVDIKPGNYSLKKTQVLMDTKGNPFELKTSGATNFASFSFELLDSPKKEDGIYFDAKAGIGYANEKRFKLKDDQSDFFVFGKLHEQIGEPLLKEDVLKIAKYEGGNLGKGQFINDLAKKMRKSTGLNVSQIVLNNGNLTLIGHKLKEIPK